MINYYSLGPDKRINEIVFAGSHDAGITSGASNVQTQSVDIMLQAAAGVRIFDLRIAAVKAGKDALGNKAVQMRAFHADGMLKKDETKTRFMPEFNRTETLERTKLRGGGFGMSLEKMLEDAAKFVRSPFGSTEFLLLKFDKSTNWSLIAEACVTLLGDTLYRGGGNLNNKTLKQLRGKVVVLFTPAGLAEVVKDYPPGSGIFGIKNVAGEGAQYDDEYNGLQYFGKGGTSPFNPRNKIAQNVKKQTKLMQAGGHANPDVMGMMYWTTTGLDESIYKRNRTMWTAPNQAKLAALWNNGLGDAVRSGAPDSLDLGSPSSGNAIKRFMPNFIMIDFADDTKCKTIFELNQRPATELVGLDDF
ncbi:MAG TPA: hypothetical protein VGV37_16725 [Aliidongia sp.]|uniref:hypothetical protein n=1 Tax=Aliidongia sp. TaxID=1914230 RepID=UPI002DDCACB9|nr:hypothetical protein [Aliidongia sp.]HEV2676171.1 hypothetical protein [Aliidongia sp.]